VERGTRNVSLDAMSRLAEALEMPLGRLFDQAQRKGQNHLIDVLLVEDMPRDIELTLRAFRRAKFNNPVHVARDGEEALDFVFCTGAFANRTFDASSLVILLDLNLPKVNGIEVLRRLKNDARTQSIPVIVLTESTLHQDAQECQSLGVDTYLRKPVDFNNFSAVTAQLPLEWKLVKTPATLPG
jgi:CheY-like chemotaxis protein